MKKVWLALARPNPAEEAVRVSRSHLRLLMRVRATPLLLLSLFLLLPAGSGHGQESPIYRLKAAFIYNFAKFIEWPPEAFANPKAPFVIGVLGDNPFGSELEGTISGKAINEHPITIKKCSTVEDAKKTHILFVCSSEKKRFEDIFKKLRGTSVLTVGETDGFIETGGLIKFVPENNKIRFQINEEGAKSAGLKISSKLLSLALRSTS